MPDKRLTLPLSILLATLALAPVAGSAQTGQESSATSSVETLLKQADEALVRGWLVAPDGRSAMDLYQQTLAIDPDNQEAREGLAAVYQASLEAALLLARELDFEAAEALLGEAESIDRDSESFAQARKRVKDLRQDYLDKAESEAVALIESGQFILASEEITDLIAIGLPRQRVNALRSALRSARLYGSYRPGQRLRDPLDSETEQLGPMMVVIASGQFMMGSPDSESGRSEHEGPRHRVVLDQGFAMAATEISVGQFAEFVEETGYTTDAEVAGWSRVYEARSGRMSRRNRVHWRHNYLGRPADPDLPVIHVSWRDASAYASWLAERTGLAYRLPTEAEFEYALRARTQSRYWWGKGTPPDPLENLTGGGDESPTGAHWSVAFPNYADGHWGPAPVGSLAANPFGLHDMGGNVMEWTEDCWHDSFVRAPSDGSAWVNPGCGQRVIRGGSWSSTPDMSRSAWRLAGRETSTDMRVGFRVARDL